MSSIQSAFAQIPRRAKYLLTNRGYNDNPYLLALSEEPDNLMSETDFYNLYNSGDDEYIDVGQLLRDMGKEVVVVGDTNQEVLYRFRKVQIVNGADTEGVPSSSPNHLYACTFDAEVDYWGVYVSQV